MQHVRVRAEVHKEFCRVKLKVRGHLEDLKGDGRIILKWIFMKENGKRELA
jgi:hypothetical protein